MKHIAVAILVCASLVILAFAGFIIWLVWQACQYSEGRMAIGSLAVVVVAACSLVFLPWAVRTLDEL